jgi:hypothetical protein
MSPGEQRAQGRPGARRTLGPPANRKAGGSHHRFARSHPAFPAQWFYGLYALSPDTGLSCPRRPQAARLSLLRTWPQRREARTTRFRRLRKHPPETLDLPGTGRSVFGRRRSSITRRATPPHPSHPASNVRDDREAPLRRRREDEMKTHNPEKRKLNIFRPGTGQ